VDVQGLTSGVSTIAAGEYHTCALTTSGGVKCWGKGDAGKLGDGTTTNHYTPVDVQGLASGISTIAAGQNHTCALTASGGVKCWGDNLYGELGDGTFTRRSTPVDVQGLASGFSAIATGYRHTCALTASGGVKCWGYNVYGQLGDGTTISRSTPVDVIGLASGVSAIATGYGHTCAVTTSGGVKCWGYNENGQLGDGTTIDRSTPVDVQGLASGVTAVAAGNLHTCALTTSGWVKCWGYNVYGQLGDGTSTSRFVPVDVQGLTSGASTIAAGYFHTCVLTTSSGVKCWGDNEYGQLGDGTIYSRSTPEDVQGLTDGISAISTGGYHTCALTASGGVKCWGDNWGTGIVYRSTTPVDVQGLASGISAIATGSYHTCVLTASSGVKCVGDNYYGQLGDGTNIIIGSSTPVDVIGLTAGVGAIAVGREYTCALTTSGGVKCWGDGRTGQLGFAVLWLPVDVVGLP
jgi:alpha-tubulin suppressor-like RCC1 family protein